MKPRDDGLELDDALLSELHPMLERYYEGIESGESEERLLARVPAGLIEPFRRVLQRSASATDALRGEADGRTGDADAFPTRLGGFEIGETLGAGGFSRVFLAEDRDLGRLVALKVLRRIEDNTSRLRFRREAEVTASLQCPSIVPIYSIGEDGPWLYIAMKHLSGDSLQVLAGRLSPREVAGVGMQIARALHLAHECGVLHRDVKPSNIVMDEEVAVLLDFGLARTNNDPRLTESDTVPGTLLYMAPELLIDPTAVDGRSDVYSLGATLYHAVSGRPPHPPRASTADLIDHIISRDPAPLSLPRSAADLETIILRALDHDPARRFPSAAAMAADLERFQRDLPIESRRKHIGTRVVKLVKRNPKSAALVATITAMALCTVAAMALQRERDQRFLSQRVERDIELMDRGRWSVVAADLDALTDRFGATRELVALRDRLDARRALRSLHDAVHDRAIQRSPSQLRPLIEAVDSHLDALADHQPSCDITRALAQAWLGDGAAAEQILSSLEQQSIAEAACAELRRHLSRDSVVDRPPVESVVGGESSVDELLFTATAFRIAGRSLEERAALIEEAWRADPTDAEVVHERAAVLSERGDHDRAISLLQGLTATSDERHRTSALYTLVAVYIRAAQPDLARLLFERLAPDPDDIRWSTHLADLLRLERSEEYASHLLRCVERWPLDPAFHRLLGQHYRERGDFAAARRHLNAAIDHAIYEEYADLSRVRLLELELEAQSMSPGGVAADTCEQADATGARVARGGASPAVRAEGALLAFLAARLRGEHARALDLIQLAVELDPSPARSRWYLAFQTFKVVNDAHVAAGTRAIPPQLTEDALQGYRHVAPFLDDAALVQTLGVPAHQPLLIGAYLSAALPDPSRFEQLAARYQREVPGDLAGCRLLKGTAPQGSSQD